MRISWGLGVLSGVGEGVAVSFMGPVEVGSSQFSVFWRISPITGFIVITVGVLVSWS